MTRIRSAWAASEQWLARNPATMTLILVWFTILFFACFGFNVLAGNDVWARVSAACAGLAGIAATVTAVQLIPVRAGRGE